MKVIFGYQHVDDVHCGICNGNYLCMEQDEQGVERMRCWCGSTCVVTFDSDQERTEFIDKAFRARSSTPADTSENLERTLQEPERRNVRRSPCPNCGQRRPVRNVSGGNEAFDWRCLNCDHRWSTPKVKVDERGATR